MAITKAGESQSYGYTGGVQSFTAPYDGLYKLEVWGASGTSNHGGAGMGGYTVGYILLKKGAVLHICCGGSGGYNGGGSGTQNSDGLAGSGGGATHIATKSGLLSGLSSDRLTILCVAGGGGGDNYAYNTLCYGGSGGGTTGGSTSASQYKNNPPISTGGSQTDGGHVTNYDDDPGQFGKGSGKRGGGGWYGGTGGGYWGSGSGGSGYIGGVPAITYKGVTYSPTTSNGVNSGNGSAKITLVEKSMPTTYYGDQSVEALYYGDFDVTGLFFGDSEVV